MWRMHSVMMISAHMYIIPKHTINDCPLNHYERSATCQCHRRCAAYLFSSSARFLRFSLVSGSGRLSAWTGPCLPISPAFHASVSIRFERTGLALCALAATLPPELTLLWSSSWSSWEEALLSEDSLATLSVMPAVSFQHWTVI
jgi:hypothetical protein